MKVEVKMVEWFSQHWYKLDLLTEDGKPEVRWIPSVTTKLGITDKPFLAKWRGDIDVLKNGLPIKRYRVVLIEKYRREVEAEGTAAAEAQKAAIASMTGIGEGATFSVESCRPLRPAPEEE